MGGSIIKPLGNNGFGGVGTNGNAIHDIVYTASAYNIDTVNLSPYRSHLSFNGNAVNGQFLRVFHQTGVASDDVYRLGLWGNFIDSFDVRDTISFSTHKAMYIMGWLSAPPRGWILAFGQTGAHNIDLSFAGGFFRLKTLPVGDTSKQCIVIHYNKGTTTLIVTINDSVCINNTAYTYSTTAMTADDSANTFIVGHGIVTNSIADTSQVPADATQFAKINLYYMRFITYIAGVRKNLTYDKFLGYGDVLLDSATWETYGRSNSNNVTPSPNGELGMLPANRDRRNPLWIIDSGTRPTYIDSVNGGVYQFVFGTNLNTNVDCDILRPTTWRYRDTTRIVYCGDLNNLHPTTTTTFGDSSFFIFTYNPISNITRRLSATNKTPNASTLGVNVFQGSIIATGAFTSCGGVARTGGVAKYDSTTLTWTELDSGITGGGSGYNSTTDGDTLYVYGNFASWGGTSGYGNICKFYGNTAHKMGTGTDGTVFDVQQYQGVWYMVGAFQQASGVDVYSFAKWNGTAWVGAGQIKLGGGIGTVNKMCIYNSELYLGGQFDVAGGVSCSGLVKFNGYQFTAVGSFTRGVNVGEITWMAVEPIHNSLAITGQFSRVNGAICIRNVWYSSTPLSAMIPYSTFTPMPPITDRGEGVICLNDSTYINGDERGVYGVDGIQYVHRLTTTWVGR